MANMYFNLAGWVRDVRAVLSDGNDRAETLRAHLLDLLEELMADVGLDIPQLDDESVSEDVESEDADDDLEGVVPRGRSGPGTFRSGPAEGRKRLVGGAAPVAAEVPRDVQEEGSKRRSRRAPVAGARGSRGKVKRGTK